MDADEEYSAYVSARWSTLMRSAILLGCQVHEAEDLVQATLVKCYVAWDKVRKAHDKDAYVFRVLVTHTRQTGGASGGESGLLKTSRWLLQLTMQPPRQTSPTQSKEPLPA